MKIKLILVTALLAAIVSACAGNPGGANIATAKPTATPSASAAASTPVPTPTSSTPKNGDYPGKGVVTKINLELGSVEMNHEEIVGVMPAMLMEFFVTDKKLLDGIKVGDNVEFVLRYKDHTEQIASLKKAQ